MGPRSTWTMVRRQLHHTFSISDAMQIISMQVYINPISNVFAALCMILPRYSAVGRVQSGV